MQSPLLLFNRGLYSLTVTVVLLLLAATVFSQQTEQQLGDPVKAREIYQQLVEKVKAGDSTIDFVELISAASDWDLSEKGSTESANRRQMVEAFKR